MRNTLSDLSLHLFESHELYSCRRTSPTKTRMKDGLKSPKKPISIPVNEKAEPRNKRRDDNNRL